MKKLLFLLLTIALVLSCLASCELNNAQDTTETAKFAEPISKSNDFEIPEDETRAVCTVSGENADGLTMEVTVYGYQSESLNKDFYVKNNEYFLLNVKVTNTSGNPLWQWLPTYCRHTVGEAHNHEIELDLSHGEYRLSSSSFGFACGDLIDKWRLEPGDTYEWQLKLAAGEVKSGAAYDLPGDGKTYGAGIDLYENDIYDGGICTFEGALSFGYQTSDDGQKNDFSLSVPLTIDVVCVSAEPNES